VLGAFGCSVILSPAREQCSTTEDCRVRGAAFANTVCVDSLCQAASDPEPEGPWRCLGNPTPPPVSTAATAHVSLPVCDSLRGCGLPIAGLTAKLCAKLDAGCTSPLPFDISYANGVFDFDVPASPMGFNGYLAIASPPELCTDGMIFGEATRALCALLPECNPAAPDARCEIPAYPPVSFFFNPPVVADASVSRPLQITSTAASLAIAQAAGIVYDPTRGSLLVTALDCDGTRASGLSFSLENYQGNPSQTLYVENNIPSRALLATDATGVGIVIDVSPGFVTVVARDASGKRVGSAGAYVAPSSDSYITLVP
jgi:hypothetical protein